jgi:hypothetical protein
MFDWNESADRFSFVAAERESKGLIIILYSVCMKKHDHFIFLLKMAFSLGRNYVYEQLPSLSTTSNQLQIIMIIASLYFFIHFFLPDTLTYRVNHYSIIF